MGFALLLTGVGFLVLTLRLLREPLRRADLVPVTATVARLGV